MLNRLHPKGRYLFSSKGELGSFSFLNFLIGFHFLSVVDRFMMSAVELIQVVHPWFAPFLVHGKAYCLFLSFAMWIVRLFYFTRFPISNAISCTVGNWRRSRIAWRSECWMLLILQEFSQYLFSVGDSSYQLSRKLFQSMYLLCNFCFTFEFYYKSELWCLLLALFASSHESCSTISSLPNFGVFWPFKFTCVIYV